MGKPKRCRRYTAPLVIHCIWNIADGTLVKPIIDRLSKLISRNIKRPFSRGINIPLFVYESLKADDTPHKVREVEAVKSICFVFTSEQTAGRKAWKSYYAELKRKKSFEIIPVALNSNGLTAFEGVNAIRYEDGDESERQERCIIAILHEIFRYGFIKGRRINGTGQDSSLKVFLSHSKGDGLVGVEVAEKLRRMIDNTNMRYFFDATVISPGQKFEEEIKKHLDTDRCAFVAIKTDGYSARYWCQREILLAKEKELPILAVDYLSDFEDRDFPALANVPVMRLSDVSDKSLFLILIRMLAETIRCAYVKRLISEYKSVGWLPSNVLILTRPPEISSICSMLSNGIGKQVCYPEPPLYMDELVWVKKLKKIVYTPLQYDGGQGNNDFLKCKSIGLSISDVASTIYDRQCHPYMLKAFAQDMARHVLSRMGRLVYGGDLRHDGFTEYIISEASAIQRRVGDETARVVNYLSWPIYVDNNEILCLRAEYDRMLDIKEIEPAADILSSINLCTPIPPTTPANRYIWSRCLTVMREKSIRDSFARVCAGGKLVGYKGKMPGVLEEVIITMRDTSKPLYLCGGFGGVSGEICDAIVEGKIPTCLTEQWQIENNVGYKELQGLAEVNHKKADYSEVRTMLCTSGVLERLASRSGLSDDEYLCLMQSPFPDECVHLVLRGLLRLSLKTTSKKTTGK